MKLRAVALAYGLGLMLATAAWAASPKSTPDEAAQTHAAAMAHGATLPITWVPDWLMEPLSRAITPAIRATAKASIDGLGRGGASGRLRLSKPATSTSRGISMLSRVAIVCCLGLGLTTAVYATARAPVVTSSAHRVTEAVAHAGGRVTS